MNITEDLTPVNHDTGREGKAITGITIHTMVGWMAGSRSVFFNAANQVSANYGVAMDGHIVRYVAEGNTAWCDGNRQSNLTHISIEHEDGGNYNGVRPDALYNASAELVADICRRYGFPADRAHVVPHFEVIDRSRYPGGTACPDGLDIDRIIRQANAILHPQAAAPAAPPAPAPVVHPYTAEDVTPHKTMVAIRDTHIWGMTYDNWPAMTATPVASVKAGAVFEVYQLIRHNLGSTYYVPMGHVAAGINAADLREQAPTPVQPAPAVPAPAPTPFSVVYEKLPQPVNYVANKQPTTVWGFNHATYPDIGRDVVKQLNKNDPFVAYGRAIHSLGSTYLMTQYSFGQADVTGTPDHYAGVNAVDLDMPPAPASVVEQPILTPAPLVEAPVVATPESPAPAPAPIASVAEPAKGTPADWRKSYKEFMQPLMTLEGAYATDLENKVEDVILKAGHLVPKAGDIWKNGVHYVLTIPSIANGDYRAIPAHLTTVVPRDKQEVAMQKLQEYWEKYLGPIEDELEKMFHEDMHFEDDASKSKPIVSAPGKLTGYDKLVDIVSRWLFRKNKK